MPREKARKGAVIAEASGDEIRQEVPCQVCAHPIEYAAVIARIARASSSVIVRWQYQEIQRAGAVLDQAKFQPMRAQATGTRYSSDRTNRIGERARHASPWGVHMGSSTYSHQGNVDVDQKLKFTTSNGLQYRNDHNTWATKSEIISPLLFHRLR